MPTVKNVYLKNNQGQQLYPLTTNVPHKEQFSFADGLLALNYGVVKAGLGLSSDSLSFSLPYQVFNSVTLNSVQLKGLPVGVKTNTGTYYPVQKSTVDMDGTSILLNVSRYLAYQGVSTFTGPWTAYFACGQNGADGAQGQQGIQGPKGDTGETGATGTAAGFGTPTASATTVSQSDSATVTVTATGQNTAKVFAFTFGIPKGQQGKSSYQVWLDQGNTGTQQDFFAAIRGGAYQYPFTAQDITGSSLIIQTQGLPVSLTDNTGNVYPLQFGSLTLGDTSSTINMGANLSAIGKAVTGTWYVNFASGYFSRSTGTQITGSTAAVTAKDNAIFKHTIVQNETITIDSSLLSAQRCATFQLWLTMGATVVSFSLPDNLIWVSSAPSFDTANTLYALVIRWDGTSYLANLAYTKSTAA